MRQEQLPIESDFYTHINDLDGQHAWKCFGGLTLEQARDKFLGNPEFHQEDFMFMGGKAFAYYFPVVEDYLKSASHGDGCGDHQAWILSRGVKNQLSRADLSHVQPLLPKIFALAEFVLKNNDRFGDDWLERRRVAEAWEELVRHMRSIDPGA